MSDKRKYVALYQRRDRSYWMVINIHLARGSQSQAQLVRNINDPMSHIVVRKALLDDAVSLDPLTMEPLVDYIQSNVHKAPPHMTPLLERFLGSRDHNAFGSKYVSYWEYCNQGNVINYLENLGYDEHPPVAFTARLCRQILSSLHYLMCVLSEPVSQSDILPINIFMSHEGDDILPNFCIGDWGRLSTYKDRQKSDSRRVGECRWDVAGLMKVMRHVLGYPNNIRDPRPVLDSVFAPLYLELKRLDDAWVAHEETARDTSSRDMSFDALSNITFRLPRSLEHLVRMAAELEEAHIGEITDADRKHWSKTPKLRAEYHASREELVNWMYDGAPGCGQWYVATVDPDTDQVLDIESEPRPACRPEVWDARDVRLPSSSPPTEKSWSEPEDPSANFWPEGSTSETHGSSDNTPGWGDNVDHGAHGWGDNTTGWGSNNYDNNATTDHGTDQDGDSQMTDVSDPRSDDSGDETERG